MIKVQRKTLFQQYHISINTCECELECQEYNAEIQNPTSTFTRKFDITKDFPKERYNTYAKSCNSNLYTKYPGATYSGLLLGTMRCL